MLKKVKILLMIVPVCCILLSSVVNDPPARINEALKKYIEEFPQEKIYLHFDKPYYSTGEIMWFKVYLVAGSYHQPSPLSQTIHVDLISQNKKLIQSVKLKSDKGFAHGGFALPDSLSTGNYVVRAYTPWMQNFTDEYFFKQEIKIFAPGMSAKGVTNEGSTDLQFFPEGGTLLNGFESKIGFKAIGRDGLGKEVDVKIVDDQSTEIARAKSNLFGMGYFTMVPQDGKKYWGVLQPSGERFAITSGQNTGFRLAVTNKPEREEVVVRIQCNPSTPSKQNLTVLLQTRGVAGYMSTVDLSNNLVYVKIPKTRLLSGISQVTLFDSQGKPVAERLIFIDHNDMLNVRITSDKAAYKPREKINLDIMVTGKDGKPAPGNFSLSVVDNQQILLNDEQGSIVEHLWLSSDLRGNIENPGYYFNPENKDRHEALDVLLLTQGWRRFVWNDILNNKWPEIKTLIDRGFVVSGKLLDNLTKKAVAGGKVTYLSGDIIVAKTADDGSFRFENLIFSDSSDVVLQGENKRGNKGVIFKLDEDKKHPFNFEMPVLAETQSEFERNFIRKSIERKKIDEAFNFDEKTIVLEGIEIRADRIEPEIEKVYGKSSSTLKMSDVAGSEAFSHPLQALQGRMAGVQVSGSGMNYNVLIRGVGSLTNSTPLIMVDNVQVDISSLSGLSPRDIESIEVYKGNDAAVFGANGANGAILFYTKRGRNSAVPREGIYNLKFAGYASPKEFYSPKYDVAKPEHAKPDKRATIFWAPVVQVDSTGVGKVSFFNNDNETTVTGVVEGISPWGTPGRGKFHYKIEK